MKRDRDSLEAIFATKYDQTHCDFYIRRGACRHNDNCRRKHINPVSSHTLVFRHMYANPLAVPLTDLNGDKVEYSKIYIRDQFCAFYADVFQEASKTGTVSEMLVADNLNPHLIGTVFILFDTIEDAEATRKALMGRHFLGYPLNPEFSHVTDFRRAVCEDRVCVRGTNCNYIHACRVPVSLLMELYAEQAARRGKGSVTFEARAALAAAAAHRAAARTRRIGSRVSPAVPATGEAAAAPPGSDDDDDHPTLAPGGDYVASALEDPVLQLATLDGLIFDDNDTARTTLQPGDTAAGGAPLGASVQDAILAGQVAPVGAAANDALRLQQELLLGVSGAPSSAPGPPTFVAVPAAPSAPATTELDIQAQLLAGML